MSLTMETLKMCREYPSEFLLSTWRLPLAVLIVIRLQIPIGIQVPAIFVDRQVSKGTLLHGRGTELCRATRASIAFAQLINRPSCCSDCI